MQVIHQPLLQPHHRRQQGGQTEQYHHSDRRHVHIHHFESEQVDGEYQQTGSPGDLRGGRDAGDAEADDEKHQAGN